VVDVVLHRQGHDPEQRAFPAVPKLGSMIDAQGQLWRVLYLIYGATVDVYAVRLADSLSGDLRAQLATWGNGLDASTEENQ